ncbi:hypothetical protein, variant [Verruconis gallopava]|uniref:EGF-like domain-containing protein n=1 Tax=Verruconis gallopava TaxID=253628 RepID=A0A0D2B917_9PEZI|nr:uncharacterized protein PV09_01678 [Verruconis gallopava]XP_016217618.1 hypothetical protein, variant [Verruconis gallopava]KIW07748.1 hypothetical protein PV09_01678 [Verruconis gallopava]KIW07749.1 hypothetical protein, variant [Verruconis gallopava]
MSFSPQRARAGNASAAGSGRDIEDAQQGSVTAARERLRAIQAVRAQATKDEQSPRSGDRLIQQTSSPPSRQPAQAFPYSPMSPQRTYDQDYDYQEPASDASWPLPASRYNPAANTASSARRSRDSGVLPDPNARSFYEAGSQEFPPETLQLPQPAFNRGQESYGVSDQYSSVTSPSAPPRTLSSTSIGSLGIPDFPLPTSQYQNARRSQNFPPQSRSRRGPSSFYSQLSGPFGVSPIPEESNSRTTNSYASSNVIPSAQMKEFFLDETPSDEDDGSSAEFNWSKDMEKNQQSSPGLVRQASLGRLQKPALTTIRSGENLRPPVATPVLPKEVPGSKMMRTSQVASILDGESVLLDASSTEQSRRPSFGNVDLSEPFNPNENTKQGFGRLGSLRKNEKGLADRRQSKLGASSDGRTARRPANIDVQAIRDAEARASLTSLPDLIRRATRLAANLDRGKTASRLGMDWMTNDDERPVAYRPSEGSSLGGMLASFPPPATMPRDPTPSDQDTAEELYKNLNVKRKRAQVPDRRGRRQICGMSRRAFIAIVLFVFFLVAAAVILPVFLILLPNKNKSTSSATVPVSTALQTCQKNHPCSNGGAVVINLDQSCGCICTNGFTGAQCTVQSNSGCTTISATNTDKATVGTDVPDLITAAQQKFSIPLDATALSSAFAVNNMTCTTENAIVTFQDASNKRRELPYAIGHKVFAQRSKMYHGRSGDLDIAISSTVDIETAPPTGTATSSTSAASAIPTAAPTTTQATSTTSAPTMGANSTTIQFAKVGVLFVLQDSRELAVAVSAQETLYQFLQEAAKGASSMPMNNITLGSGYFIDLTYYSVTLRNSTKYGIGVNFNGTATGFNNAKRATSVSLLTHFLF